MRANDNKRSTPHRKRFGLPTLLFASVALAACSGDGAQSALDPQGPIARDIDELWDLVFVLATIVFVLVMIAFFVAIIRFRAKKGDDTEPVQVHGNNALEITWTILPAVILAVIAVPTVQGIFDIRGEPEGERLDIDVVGHQWWWEFTYPEYTDADGRVLTTANELHIPAGETVYLTMTSTDVIHSFWVPPLNGKRDVVPGNVSNLKLFADPGIENEDRGFGAGVIPGQCAEFCGLAHADMRLRVFVHSPADFEAWVASQLEPAQIPAEGTLAAAGYETFNLRCTACHAATVSGPEGVEVLGSTAFWPLPEALTATTEYAFAPNLTHFGGRTTFGGASFDNVREHLAQWLANPADLKPMDPDRNVISEGRILGMPNFGLSSQEIEGLIALLETWD